MLLMGKSTISMAIFNSYVCLPEGISIKSPLKPIKSPLSHDIPSISSSTPGFLFSWLLHSPYSDPFGIRSFFFEDSPGATTSMSSVAFVVPKAVGRIFFGPQKWGPKMGGLGDSIFQ